MSYMIHRYMTFLRSVIILFLWQLMIWIRCIGQCLTWKLFGKFLVKTLLKNTSFQTEKRNNVKSVLLMASDSLHEGYRFNGGKGVLRGSLSKKSDPYLNKHNQNYKNQTSRSMSTIRLELRTYRIPALSVTSRTLAMAFNGYNSVKLWLYRFFLRNIYFFISEFAKNVW